MDWHSEADTSGEPEGFWTRMTRKVIRELIGIDDRLLSILLGERLPDEEDLSSTPRASARTYAPMPAEQPADDNSWQLHVLERVARELGHLVNHLSHHPGAFSTYARVQQMPLPYAGLPVIPEAAVDLAPAPTAPVDPSLSSPEFQPTLGTHVRPITIPGLRSLDTAPAPLHGDTPLTSHGNGTTFTQDEWEQDLDIKLVFRYLRSRFTRGSASSSPAAPPFSGGTSHLATSSTQETAAKAARVRQHHPLVSRMRTATERRPSFKATAPASPVALRHASSCASQSTRRSARRSSVSSRHYWDIGGSVGTGSVIASAGPMGSWGEV